MVIGASSQRLLALVCVATLVQRTETHCQSQQDHGHADPLRGIEILFPPHRALVRCSGMLGQLTMLSVKFALAKEMAEKDTVIELFSDGIKLYGGVHPKGTSGNAPHWIMVKGMEYLAPHVIEVRAGDFVASSEFFLDRLDESEAANLVSSAVCPCGAWY